MWVDRPVSHVADGAVQPGRYLDRRPPGPIEPTLLDGTAYGELGGRFGGEFVDRTMRTYLEKIDGVALELIPGPRAIKLLVEQAAPDGFWFPRHGIGQLMDAMSEAVAGSGGDLLLGTRATGVDVQSGRVHGVTLNGTRTIATDALVASVPSVVAASLAQPAPPEGTLAPVRMRAVCIVYLSVDRERVSNEPWIQVEDPSIVFSRVFEPRNWSDELAPPESTLLGLECYCQASDEDPIWSLSDEGLAETCRRTMVDRLGWLHPEDTVRLVQLVRLPRAYPVPDLQQWPAVVAPGEWLSGIDGLYLAPGAAVVEAIEQGERAAAEILSRAQLVVT